MKKLIYAINVSVDGYCDHTLANPNDQVLDYFTQLTRDAEILLYGRKTYELMIPYWPEAAKQTAGQSRGEIDFAKAFISVPRIVVFSKTLKSPEQNKTTVIRDNVEDEIKKLKEGSGKNILVGGVSFPSELLHLGLVDEIHLIVHPIIATKGRRLFESADLKENLNLKLIDSHPFPGGAVALHYSKQ